MKRSNTGNTHLRSSLHIAVLFATLMSLSGCSSMWSYGGRDQDIPGTTYYTVQRDDTVASISKRFNIAPRSLALLNGIRNGDSLITGQSLLVSFGRATQRSKSPF
ncbi:MAG: LysM peptidoglycan-binding domain-containing protein, partial [Deltaproteobacteria bacterium]|nr:LysM peptidoglycan-binding domain-containing protein [Deltaproteobacteria bacterium]